jgi:hypothetical protein
MVQLPSVRSAVACSNGLCGRSFLHHERCYHDAFLRVAERFVGFCGPAAFFACAVGTRLRVARWILSSGRRGRLLGSVRV